MSYHENNKITMAFIMEIFTYYPVLLFMFLMCEIHLMGRMSPGDGRIMDPFGDLLQLVAQFRIGTLLWVLTDIVLVPL